jgi:CheY-like chemotaxis protein
MSLYYKNTLLIAFYIFTSLNLICKAIDNNDNNTKVYENYSNPVEFSNYLNKTAITYWQEGNYEKAIEYFHKSISINKQINNKNAIKILTKYIALIYTEINNYDSAIFYLNKTLDLLGNYKGNSDELCEIYSNLAQALQGKGQYLQSNEALEKAEVFAKELNNVNRLISIYSLLAENYEKLNQPDKSYEYYSMASSLSKHIQEKEILKYEGIARNAEAEKAEKEKQLKNTYDTLTEIREISKARQMQIDLLNKEKQLQEMIINEKIQKERNRRFVIVVLSSAILIMLFFIFIIFKQLNAIKKANKLLAERSKEIEKQKEKIEEQHELLKRQSIKITSSINYARQIQQAVLPPMEAVKKIFPEHFILFRPRDIVSGDFYWITEKEGVIIVAAADCTGHGVPGAFMSMLGIATLNEIVNKTGINKHIRALKANEILNQLRDQIIVSLHQTGAIDETKDGMDMALCIIDIENKVMQYAGAHNPLILIRDNQLIQYDADKMPISIHIFENKPFTNHEIKIQRNDMIYLFTDGYSDQVGENGTKIMTRNFKNLLLQIHQKPIEEQLSILEKTLDEHMGSKEQVDDILVFGIRLTENIRAEHLRPRKNWDSKRILIAEDTDINYFLLYEALKPTKASVFRAKNGAEAVEFCKNNEVDLILMDINMPVLNGLEATKEIRKFNKNLPIIAQTAQSQSDDKEKCLKSGCNDYIAKPIDLSTFLEKIDKLLFPS